jgi:hypothetical protein
VVIGNKLHQFEITTDFIILISSLSAKTLALCCCLQARWLKRNFCWSSFQLLVVASELCQD